MLILLPCLWAQTPTLIYPLPKPVFVAVNADDRAVRIRMAQAGLRSGGTESTRKSLHLLADLLFLESESRWFAAVEDYNAAFDRCFDTPGCTIFPRFPVETPLLRNVLMIDHRLLWDFPDDPDRDQTLYQAGYVAERLGENPNLFWKELAEKNTGLAQTSWLALGEQAFRQQNWDVATDWYQRLADAAGPAAMYAHSMLGWCWWNRGDLDRAVAEMVVAGQTSGQIGDQSRKDAIWFFASAGEWQRGIRWSATFPEARQALIIRLAGALIEEKRWSEGEKVLRVLIHRWPSDPARWSWALDLAWVQRVQHHWRPSWATCETILHESTEADIRVRAWSAWVEGTREALTLGQGSVWDVMRALAARKKLPELASRERFAQAVFDELLRDGTSVQRLKRAWAAAP